MKKKSRKYLILSLLGILILLSTGKDIFHAFVKDYPFYLSESLLFGLFWFLFIPLILLIRRTLNKHNHLYVVFILTFVFSLLHISLFSMLVFSISGLFLEHTFGFARVFTDTIADKGIACILIYLTVGVYFLKTTKPPPETPKKTDFKIRVMHQNKIVLLSGKDIMYIHAERPYIAIVTGDKRYLHSTSLKSFLEENPSENFIRIHKSTVVNIHYIKSYKSRKNGDYDVTMANGDILRASRNYSSYFRPAK